MVAFIGIFLIVVIFIIYIYLNYFNNITDIFENNIINILNILTDDNKLINIFNKSTLLTNASFNKPKLCKKPKMDRVANGDLKMEAVFVFDNTFDNNYNIAIENEITRILEKNMNATVDEIIKVNDNCDDILTNINEQFIKERNENNNIVIKVQLNIKQKQEKENDTLNNDLNNIKDEKRIAKMNEIEQISNDLNNIKDEKRIAKMNEIEQISKKYKNNIQNIINNNDIIINNNEKTINTLNNDIIQINKIINEINDVKIAWLAEDALYNEYKLKTIKMGDIDKYTNFKNMKSYINNTIDDLNKNIISKNKKIIEIKLNTIEKYSENKLNDINDKLNELKINNNNIDNKTINILEKINKKLEINNKTLLDLQKIKNEWDAEIIKYSEYFDLLKQSKYINYNKFKNNYILKKNELNDAKRQYNDEIIRTQIILQNAKNEIINFINIKDTIENEIMIDYNVNIDVLKAAINKKITDNNNIKFKITKLKSNWLNINNEYNLHIKFNDHLNEINETLKEMNNIINRYEEMKNKINKTILEINKQENEYINIENDHKNEISNKNVNKIIYNNQDVNKITNELQNIVDLYKNTINKFDKLLVDNVNLNDIIPQYYNKFKQEYNNKINIYKTKLLEKITTVKNEIDKENQILNDFNKINLVKTDQYCAAKEIKIGQGEQYKGNNNINKCYMDLKHNPYCRHVSDSFMINPETGDCYCYIFTDCNRLWDEPHAQVYKMHVDENTQKAIDIAYNRIQEEEERNRLEAIEREKALKILKQDKLKTYNDAREYLLTIGDIGMLNKDYILSTHDEHCAYDTEYKVGEDERYMGKTGPYNCYTDIQNEKNCEYADGFNNNIKTGDCYCYMNNYCDAYRFRMTVEPYDPLLFNERNYNIHLKEIFSEMFNIDINFIQIYHGNRLIQIIFNKINPMNSEIIIKEINNIINDNTKKNILLEKIKKKLPKTNKITVLPMIKNGRWGEIGAFIFQINQNEQMQEWAKQETIRLTKKRENSASQNRLKKYNNTRKYILNNEFKNSELVGIDSYCGTNEKLVGNGLRYTGNDSVLNCYSDMLSACVEPIGFMTNIKDGVCYCYEKTYLDDDKQIEDEFLNSCTYKFPESGAFTYLLNNKNVKNDFV